MSGDASRPAVTFIVRATRDHGGRLRGIVERVKTGAKERFTGAEGLGGLIEQMLERCHEVARSPRRDRRGRHRRARGVAG